MPNALMICGALLGLAASMYAHHVEVSLAAAMEAGDSSLYAPSCGSSCATVLGSPQAHILSHWGLVEKGSALDVSNALTGAAFYALAALNGFAPGKLLPRALFLVMSVGTLLFSLYLAWVLKYVLKTFCIVCATMYFSNFLVFLSAAKEATSKPAKAKAKAA